MVFSPRLIGSKFPFWYIEVYSKELSAYNLQTHEIKSRGLVNVFDISINYSAENHPQVLLHDKTDLLDRIVVPFGAVRDTHIPSCIKAVGADAA
jgi:hypothetical protein